VLDPNHTTAKNCGLLYFLSVREAFKGFGSPDEYFLKTYKSTSERSIHAQMGLKSFACLFSR
jgi:hypothetical protein